jgi:thiol-disulfide isomerase/thioredoxin
MTIKKWPALVYISISSLLIVSCNQRPRNDKRIQEQTQSLANLIGEKFELKNIIDSTNKVIELDFTKSDITIVDLWFTECKACIEDMSQFSKILPSKKGKISVISISINQFWLWKATLINHAGKFSFLKNNVENWSQYTLLSPENQKLKNEVSLDRQDELAKLYDVTFYPAYFVIDRKGVIQARPISAVDFIKHYN